MTHERLIRSFAAAILSFAASPVDSQQLDALNRRRAETMLEITRNTISSQYFDSTFRGLDLAAAYDTARARIAGAPDFDRALTAVAQFVLDLRDSHTFFLPPQRTVWAEYGWDMFMIGDTCFVLSVNSGSDAEKQGVRPGDAIMAVNGFRPTRDNLVQLLYLFRMLQPQRVLRATLRAPGGATRTVDLAAEIHERKRIVDLTGADGGEDIARLIRDAERGSEDMRSELVDVDDSTVVWRLPTFAVDRRIIDDGIDHIRKKRQLILDLRGNGGGPVTVLQRLVGRLSRDPVTLGIEHERRKQAPMVAEGAGDDAYTGRVMVLVDSRSASASEITARIVQLTGRGRVLGDRTAGAVMRSRFHRYWIGTQTVVLYGISVTEADVEMPDGGRLEGVGVRPDELILPTAEDLAAQRDPVLARALTLAGRPTSADDAGGLLPRRRR